MQIVSPCKKGKAQGEQKTNTVFFNDRKSVNVSGFTKKWALFEQPVCEASCVTYQGITIITPVTCCDQLPLTLQSVLWLG